LPYLFVFTLQLSLIKRIILRMSNTFPYLFAPVTNLFEFCLIKCRTSSQVRICTIFIRLFFLYKYLNFIVLMLQKLCFLLNICCGKIERNDYLNMYTGQRSLHKHAAWATFKCYVLVTSSCLVLATSKCVALATTECYVWATSECECASSATILIWIFTWHCWFLHLHVCRWHKVL